MRDFRWLIACVGLALVLAPWLSSPAPQSLAEPANTVLLNELAWAGSSLSSLDEWIELYNPTSSSVDISGWQLTKSTPAEDLMVTLPAGAVIAATGFYVVSNFDAAHSVLAVDPNLVDSAVTLSNSQLLVRLYSGDWHNAVNLVDTAGSGGLPPAGDNALKLSMERAADGSWHDAVSATNLDQGVVDIATPAAVNSEISLPPTIESISPNTAIAGEPLQIEAIAGTNFSEPLSVRLIQGDVELVADGVHLASSTLIDGGSWQLGADLEGSWGLEVTVGTGAVAVLPDCVSISPPEPDYDLSNDIRINELYPRPSTNSNDEFIELTNRGSSTVDLTGWVLDDIENGGSSPYTLSGSIAPYGFLVIYKPASKITLNDAGDSVRLLQPTGLMLDSTSYDAAPSGQSWARTSSGWEWTDVPTPNGINVIHLPSVAAEPPPALEPDDSIASFPAGSLVIDELLPRPLDGEDEFIELRNASLSSIPLKGWQVRDTAKKAYTFSEGSLASGGRLVLYKAVSKISLNDTSGETINLLDPSGHVIDSLGYPDTAVEGAAYIRLATGGTWVPFATPGQENPSDLIEVESEVGGWVAADVAQALPVTGIWPPVLTGLDLLLIMIWQIFGNERNIFRK